MAIQHHGEAKSNAVRRQYDAYVGHAQAAYTPSQAVVERAKGVFFWTPEGRKLTDFSSGVLVSNLGYGHARFEARLARHLGKLPRNAYNLLTGVEAEASKRLIESMGSPRLQKVLWAASGSEAVQKAMWCALHRQPERHVMVATRHGFHGKKGLASEVSGTASRNPFVHFIPFPMHEEHPPKYYYRELDELLQAQAGKIALLITEPYLGAAGSFHPPAWYHQLLQDWCRAHNIAFIFDEVQSCFGRTGKMYAFQTYGVEPDLVVLGKGMGSGVPVAAVAGRADLIEALDFGDASDTWSAHPEGCAAVCATLDVFKSQRVAEHARAMAKPLARGLAALKKKFGFITAVRGEGMVYGLETMDPAIAERCVLEAYKGDGKRGVHLMGPLAGKVLRISPPLVISKPELDAAFKLLEKSWARI